MATAGRRIKGFREAAGISQTELAAKIGVSKQSLYKYENDIITNIPSDKIELIASVLGISPADIMGWIEHDDHIQKTNDRTLAYIISMYNLFDDSDKSEIIALIRAKEMKYREKEKGYSAS